MDWSVGGGQAVEVLEWIGLLGVDRLERNIIIEFSHVTVIIIENLDYEN